MTSVGWIGLGKLGLTCALALAHLNSDHGIGVRGYDISDGPRAMLDGGDITYTEAGLQGLLNANSVNYLVQSLDSVREVVSGLDEGAIVFISAPTPHSPRYGGETPAPYDTKDFEYGHLITAVRSVAQEAKAQQKLLTLVVISTVLPGTSHKYLTPLLNEYTRFVYNPFFIAMGTTVKDFVEPEFVLLGSESEKAVQDVTDLYRKVHDRPIRVMSVESAELTKVSYNTYISMKIVFANTLMEICEKTGADVDQVTQALASADQRITSGAYMHGGMGDGGGCHPRDNIAMSHLARQLDLHADPFTFVTDTRTNQSEWLASVVDSWCDLTGMDPVVLGVAYKPESNLTLGSPALLLAHQLKAGGKNVSIVDPFVNQLMDEFQEMRKQEMPTTPRVFFIGAKHAAHPSLEFPKGSVVIDPFGYIPDYPGITVIRLGRKA